MRFGDAMNVVIEKVIDKYVSRFDKLRSKKGSLSDAAIFLLQFGITSTILTSGLIYGGTYLGVTGNAPTHMNPSESIKRKLTASYKIC